jgi:hypothetical protein
MDYSALRIAREGEVLIFLSFIMIVWAVSFIRSEKIGRVSPKNNR